MASLSYLNCIGSSFHDFLKEECIFKECETKVLKNIKQMEEELIKIQPIHKEVPQIFEYAIKINEKLDSILDEK